MVSHINTMILQVVYFLTVKVLAPDFCLPLLTGEMDAFFLVSECTPGPVQVCTLLLKLCQPSPKGSA